MASRLMSRSLVSSARSAFQSGRNSFRAASGHSASSTTRPPSSSNRNPLRNDSTNFRRRCAKTMIPLHDAVAGATLISHLAVSSRSRSALSLERCCRWIWEFCLGSNQGVVFEQQERSRSSRILWHTVELPDEYRSFMNEEYDVSSSSSGTLNIQNCL